MSDFFDVNPGVAASVQVVEGPVVSEVWQTVADGWLSQKIRLWAGAASADIESDVGPIPLPKAPEGKEVVTRYATTYATNGKWATDSNLREMIPRVRDYRSSWNYTVFEPIAVSVLLVAPFAPSALP